MPRPHRPRDRYDPTRPEPVVGAARLRAIALWLAFLFIVFGIPLSQRYGF